jgi:hypothetical protein
MLSVQEELAHVHKQMVAAQKVSPLHNDSALLVPDNSKSLVSSTTLLSTSPSANGLAHMADALTMQLPRAIQTLASGVSQTRSVL